MQQHTQCHVCYCVSSLQVLVHGEATVMARLKAALLREYEDSQVYACTHKSRSKTLILCNGKFLRGPIFTVFTVDS